MAKNLFDYVHEILAQRDTLVVPDFGAFVLQKTTTFLNDSEYISIIFTAQQQSDDGVLKNYIADKTNQNIEEVEDYISSFLEEVLIEINNNSIYKVEGIGEFRAINDSIVFKPYDEQYLKGAEEAKDAENAEEVKLSLEEAAAAFLEKEGEEVVQKVEVVEIVEVVQKGEEVQKVEDVRKVEDLRKVKEVVEEKQEKQASTFDIKKYSIGIIIFIIVSLLACTLYCFRNEIANLNKPSVTNDTTQVATQENMQQLSDTLSDINSEMQTQDQSISVDTTSTLPTIVNAEQSISNINTNNINANADVILKGNITSTTYFITKGSFNNKQQALTEKQNLDVTGFVANVIETINGKKYHVVVAEFNTETSAREELNFYKKIDKQFYLMTVKPNDK